MEAQPRFERGWKLELRVPAFTWHCVALQFASLRAPVSRRPLRWCG